MSLITSCPACGTMFRVVPDQLKISEGWVRCGHCSEVFDATAHLAQGGATPAPGHQEPAPPDAGLPDESIRGWEATTGSPLSTLPDPLVPAAVERTPQPWPAPPADPALLARASEPAAPGSRFGPDSELEPSALDSPFVFRRSDLVDHDAMASVLPPAPGDSRLPQPDDTDGDDDAALTEQPSFVRQARRKSAWRRPMVRLVLACLCLLLAGALALQLAYQERDRLAAAQPALRPALQQMCAYLACTLGHPRQIEAILIDSSGFNRLRGDSYRLTFNVRNAAATRVATPALELTLTDSQDQPLLRRVLLPQELGASDGFIAPGAEWAGTAGVDVVPGSAGRVAGYRLLAFYP